MNKKYLTMDYDCEEDGYSNFYILNQINRIYFDYAQKFYNDYGLKLRGLKPLQLMMVIEYSNGQSPSILPAKGSEITFNSQGEANEYV